VHHQKAGRQLSRNTSHRKAMFRNMVDSLMELECIETTLPKAKELRKYADRVITLAKRGTLATRRKAMNMMRRREVMLKVFDDLAERYRERPGGYTRILHLGPRNGDRAPMALVELVDRQGGEIKPKTKKSSKSQKDEDLKKEDPGKGLSASPAKKEAAAAKKAKSKEKDKSKKSTEKSAKEKASVKSKGKAKTGAAVPKKSSSKSSSKKKKSPAS